MSTLERYDDLVLGSGEAGKYIFHFWFTPRD
jgi:hypothetical protein